MADEIIKTMLKIILVKFIYFNFHEKRIIFINKFTMKKYVIL